MGERARVLPWMGMHCCWSGPRDAVALNSPATDGDDEATQIICEVIAELHAPRRSRCRIDPA